MNISHPAPQRDHIGPATLLFGIAAAPAAWNAPASIQRCLIGHGCYPHAVPWLHPYGMACGRSYLRSAWPPSYWQS